jgi:hypothetical protein
MCYDYYDRLAWIRRMEQTERELKEAELAKAEARKKQSEGRQPVPQTDAQEEPVPV